MALLSLTDAMAVAYLDAPPLYEEVTATLPPILILIDKLLQSTYTLVPKTLVREEKNKATNFHGSSTNLTVHLERKATLETVPAQIAKLLGGSTFTLKGTDAQVLVALANVKPSWDFFVSSLTAIPEDQASSYQDLIVFGGIKYDAQFHVLGCHPDNFILRQQSRLVLTASDEAMYLACLTRLMELTIADICEFKNHATDAEVQELNNRARGRAQFYYTYFLISVLRNYLKPFKVQQ